MSLLRRKPWLPVLFFYLSFIGVWVWFAWFAIKNSPASIPDPVPTATPARTAAVPSASAP